MESYEQASSAILKLLAETGGTFSGETGPKVDTPLIVNAKGEVVAYISQNGKVWAGKPQDRPSGAEPLFNPYARPQIEPGADNKPQMVIPGAEQLTPEQAKKAAEAEKAKKELEIRRKQSKLRKSGQESVEDQEGGLFGGSGPKQSSILDTPEQQPAADDFDAALTSALDAEFGARLEPTPRPPRSQGTKTKPASEPQAPNRLVIQTGVVLRTKSGRETSPAPKIEATSDRKTNNTLKRMHSWLLEEARKEVEGDEWQTLLLKGMDVDNLSQSDQDHINLVLFDDPQGATDANVVRVEGVGKKSTAPKTAGEAAASAVKNTAMSLDQATKGLMNLFGGNKLSSGFTFDEDTYAAAKPYFKAALAHLKEAGKDIKALVAALVAHLRKAGMDRDGILAMSPYMRRFTDDVVSGKESLEDAPGGSEVLEPDRGDAAAGDGVGAGNVPASGSADGRRPAAGGKPVGGRGGRGSRGGSRVSETSAPVVGENGNLELPAREPGIAPGNPTDREPLGGPPDRGERLPDDQITAIDAVENAAKKPGLDERIAQQKAAEGIPSRDSDLANIRETLPVLHPQQQEDVHKVEQRFAKPDGHGMLLTNGTGTGKTLSGLGVVKRFARQGKNNILIVAPSQGILLDWQRTAKWLDLDVSILDDTKSKGEGIVATTYANLGTNPTLADRAWDLVVTDESHKLSSDKDGSESLALAALRSITLHPDGMWKRGEMIFRREHQRAEALKPPKKGATREQQDRYEAAYKIFRDKVEEALPQWRTQPRSKVLMLSATPFAYHFSLDYAEGYLYRYPEVSSRGGYNAPGPRDQFYIENLGYRMRTGKLNKPDAAVNTDVMERQLHERFKREGALAGRALEVERDYDRKFLVAHSGVGAQMEQAFDYLKHKGDPRFAWLYDQIMARFDYLSQMRLLEAIKAQGAIPYIKKSHALGRKVVVFHNYNEGGGFSPFDFTFQPDRVEKVSEYVKGPDGRMEHRTIEFKPAEIMATFVADNPYVTAMKFGDYPSPIIALTKAFPDALLYNGNVSVKDRDQAKRLFNDDGPQGRNLIIVQSDAGEAGISLHDTSGKHQRVLLNLGMPVKPVTAIQQEGRIYRVGQLSDALFRYMTTGLKWERWAFASRMALRSSTAENLSMGDLARAIKQSFIDAFNAADEFDPEPGEGVGGKKIDRGIDNSITEFERAKTFYFAQGKKRGRRDQREGVDYFATPEPLGLKMVEWADIKSGEKVLEPSAGHGAIARFFPESTARTIVEPSEDLASRAALASPGARVVNGRFEDLDIVNKFDAIVMNPPFGSGGKTAIEHIDKASKHLRNGGRIVALIPRGGMADKRFDNWYESAKGLYLVGNITLPTVTFERAGTQVATRVVIIERQTDKDVRPPQQRERDYSSAETINEFFDRIEDTDMGQRAEPLTKEADIPAEGEVTIGGVRFNLHSRPEADSHFADLSEFIGDRFGMVARNAEAEGGHYVRSTRSFVFPSQDARQRFLDRVEKGEDPRQEPTREEAAAGPAPAFDLAEFNHTMTGDKVYVATAKARMADAQYRAMNALVRKHGGNYSNFRGRGAIPGFHFKSEEARAAFLQEASEPPKEAPLSSRGRLSAAKTPGFYSGLLRAVENLKQEKAPAAQWLGTIRNQPGVRPEEIAWLGLDDWLGRQTGTVTKAQIADFVRANQVQVSEVQKGAPIEPADIAAKRTRFQELNDIDDGVGPYRGRRRDLTSDEADEMRRLSMDLSTAPNPWLTSTPGKFETYQLPGGENYRELLLTLPERPNINTNTIWSWQYRAEGGTALTRQDAQARVIEAARRPGLTFGRQSAPTDEQIFAEARIEPTQDQSDNAGPNYRSPHWDEPNVVAHVRFNERTDAEGKKVLFIEEIQSDWMQQGRKHGFRGQRIPANVSDALIEWGKAKSAKYGNGIDITTAQQAIDNYGVVEAQQVADKFDYQIKAGSQAVPDAPFKTTWPELAMKRMVRWAAENGFDRIAWTPGSVQIERYWGNQSVSDAVDRFKEIAKPQSVRELAENIFGREMAASMPLQSVDGGMLSVMQHDQVRRNIIVNTPVDVMDLLRAHQLSPEQLFSNDRVVADRLSVDSRRRVIAGILSASRLTGASIRAKLGALKPGGSDVEILPALRASQLNSREVAGLLSPQSIFHLGTGRAPELAAATGAGAEPLPGGEGGVLNGKVPAAELANLLNAHVTIKYGRDALLRQGFEAPPGQGMVGFYDKILVDTARKLGKKFGATVGKTIIDNQGGEFPWVVRDVTDDGAGRIVDTFPTEAAAREYMAIEDGGHELAFEPTDLPMHSLDIPQAMRDAAMQGQPLFRQTRNRFRFILNQKQAAQLTAEINQIAADLLGHHLVGVETRDTLEADFSADEDAVFDPNTRLIWVALRGTQDPRLAVRHEAIHALHHAGVFTAKEWAVLSRVAQSHWMHEFNIRERYESLYRQRFDLKPEQIEQLLIEEAIAEAFAEHMSARPQDEALITRIFNRVLRFIEAVRNLLAGHGYTTADQVLQEVETGAVGRRSRAGQGQARQFPLSARQDSLPQAPLSSRGRLRPPRNPAAGSFDAPHDERMMRALNDTTDTLLGRLKRAGKAFAIEGVRKLQDREVDLLRTQNAITKASGSIAESKDAYLAASLYPGRVAQKDKDLLNDVIKPLVKDIAARGLSLREVDDFVRARHGIERNLVVGQLYKPGEQFHDAMTNPAVKGASGLSEDEITQILDGFQNSGKLADLEAVGDKIVALNARSLRAELAEGLIDQDLYDQLTTQYRYYVPLRGWDEATSDAFPEAPRTGSRFDIRGKEHQQAFGRTTLSDSPLAFSILQARQAIVRIEKNRVAKRFLRLAQANPNEAFWQVNRRDLKKVIDQNTGLVRRVYDRGSTQAENVLAAKVGGQTFHVTLHHEGTLRAMKGIGGANMHGAVVFFHKINRYLAALNTSLDPEFIFRNFLRDLQHAGIVLQEEKQKGLVADVLKSIPQATAGMNRMLNGDLSTHWARVAREFADAGGKVGFMDRGDIDAEKRNLNRLMKSATGGAGRKTAEFLFEATFGRIERYNDAIENTLRLATYAGLRKRGVSQDKAAFVARELTVNFNRKGEWGPYINAFYLFFNASMQGAAQLAVRLKRSKRLRYVAAGIVGAALVQDIINRIIAGDDDDDKNRYDKIPDDIKAHYSIIMMPKWFEDQYGIPYYKWPLPLGWNMFHVIGTQTGHVLAGARSPLEAGSNMVGAIGDAFNPLGSGGFVNWLAPTLMDPAIDLYANTDFWGDDIVPKTYDDTKPLAERYNQNVTPGAKMLTDTLSKATGGSPERPGSIDVSPEQVEYLWDFATGGVGRLLSRAWSTGDAIAGGDAWDAMKTPFVRVFVGQDSKYIDRDEYYQIKNAVEITQKELKGRTEDGDAAAVERVRRDHAPEVQMIKFVDKIEKRLAKLRKDARKITANDAMPDDAKKTALDGINAERDRLQQIVRKRWNQIQKTTNLEDAR